jgi:septum formation protein
MLVLASASPRRKELLTQAGYAFHVIPANIPEQRQPDEEPTAFVTRLAHEKARAVYDQLSRNPGDDSSEDELLVLGADTIVVTPGEILGKPKDSADAARMLRLLSGKTHKVVTGVCLLSRNTAQTAAETTAVTMKEFPQTEIEAYIATGEPMDKAGAYAIQGYAARWIPRIEGCYFNVVGLPLALVASMIEARKLRQRSEADVHASAL